MLTEINKNQTINHNIQKIEKNNILFTDKFPVLKWVSKTQNGLSISNILCQKEIGISNLTFKSIIIDSLKNTNIEKN